MRQYHRQKSFAVIGQFARADARDGAQRLQRLRFLRYQLGQGSVVEDHVGGYALGIGQRFAMLAQRFPQYAVALGGRCPFGSASRRLAGFAQGETLLAAQYGPGVGGELDRAMALHVHAQIAAGDQLAKQRFPLAGGELFANAERTQTVMTEAADTFVALAEQHIHQVSDAEALFGAVDARQRLLRSHRGLPGVRRGEAVIAVAAGFV